MLYFNIDSFHVLNICELIELCLECRVDILNISFTED